MIFEKTKHSIEVANEMISIGKKLNMDEEEQQELFLLGYLHDIGYNFTSNLEEHNIVGGNILKNNGYKYWKEVYYHGNPNKEYKSLYLNILNEADMKIDSHGNNIGFEERLNDILTRYGKNSNQYINARKIIEDLKTDIN